MIIAIIIAAIVVILLVWLTISHSFLVPKKGLPILMYHKVSENRADGLTIPVAMLERQFSYLRDNGFQTIFFEELASIIHSGLQLPRKTLVITFDDGYESFSEYALPLLEKFNHKATVFIPVGYMGKKNEWDDGHDPVMSQESLKQIKKGNLVEFGLHSFLHGNYKNMMLEEMKEDLLNCINTLNFYSVPFVRVLAYPYGGFPRKDKILLQRMKELLREFGFDFALRIGNRINRVPFVDPYELKRIDIKGTDSFSTFRIKLRKGRKKLFS